MSIWKCLVLDPSVVYMHHVLMKTDFPFTLRTVSALNALLSVRLYLHLAIVEHGLRDRHFPVMAIRAVGHGLDKDCDAVHLRR